MDANNEELLKDFFSEAEQQVENLESNILVIENDPSNHEAIDEIFRAAHTLKGGSATVEMNELATFTHSVEDVLDELRSDRLKVDENVVDILLNSIDVIKNMLEARSNGTVYDGDVAPLLDKLHAFIPAKDKTKGKTGAQSSSKPSIAVQASPAPAASSSPAAAPNQEGQAVFVTEAEYTELKRACTGKQRLWTVTVQFDENNPMNSVGGIQVFSALKACGTVLKTVPDFDALYEDEFYPTVVYFLATESSAEKLEDIAFLSDVTLSTDAKELTENSIKSDASGAAQSSGQAQQQPSGAAPSKPAEAQSSSAAASSSAQAAPSQTEAAPAASQKSSTDEKGEDKPKTAAAAPSHSSAASSILRVDSRRIDYLLNLVSETVITKASFNQQSNQLSEQQIQFQSLELAYKERIHRLFEQISKYFQEVQNGASVKDIQTAITQEFGDIYSFFDAFETSFKGLALKFRASTQNLGRITGELQEGVMKIRMVPISQIFNRFPRVVRDLQRDLNKKIDLVVEGEETELDKTVVDDLLDPIMHCVRNSVDHGVESPADRVAAGKSETGTVTLKAANEGNMINIDISDDGAGINIKKVKEKAVQRGLIHPDKILTEQEAAQLIFHPGFSTADKITNVSGRGVGLDVVKTMIDKLNGTVTVSSELGKGTTFSIRLPLTLAIIQGLLVRVGKEVYSIPVASVIESRRVHLDEISTIDNYEVLNVRNEVISILRLNRLFNIPVDDSGEYHYIVIVGAQNKKLGIMVDALIGEEDVVIKPLRDQFTDSPGIAGASILGDGSVSLIIDVSQLLDLGVSQEIDAQKAVAAGGV